MGGSVYGGYSASGDDTSGNTVRLMSNGITINGNLMGGNNASTVTGNTLRIGAYNETVTDTVGNFEKISLGSGLWNVDNTVLAANQFTNFGILDLTESSLTTHNSNTVLGTMTLLSSATANNFDGLTLKYATDKTVTLNSDNPSFIFHRVTESDTVNGVTLNYDKVRHTVSLDDSYKKVNYTKAEPNLATKLAFGNVEWSAGGTLIDHSTTWNTINFDANTAIDTSNFRFDTPQSINAGDSMTLLAGATGLTAGDDIAHTQDFTKDETNGAKLNATLSGNITRTADTLGYTATGTTLNSVNLANWNGTASAVPTGWTGSNVPVNTGFFSLPNETTTILTANTANFFGTVSGTRAYIATPITTNRHNGISIDGNSASGVKVEAYNGLANAKVTYYAPRNFATLVTLGNITWDTSAPAWSSPNFIFNADTAIDASNLTFTGTATTALKTDSTSKMTLLSGVTGAENIPATNITQPSAGKGTLAVNYTNNEEINFTATASGEVTVTTNQVDYTINNVTLSGVDLADWNGTTSEVPTGWTANTDGVSVTGDGFTAPSITTGNSVDILTTGTDGYFSNANISDAIQFNKQEGVYDTDKGVKLLGIEWKGVTASEDGKNLIYERDFKVDEISFGSVKWDDGRELPGTVYDFHSLYKVDATNLSFEFTDEQKNALATGSTMTLLSNANRLPSSENMATKEVIYNDSGHHTQAIDLATANGTALTGGLEGTFAFSDSNNMSFQINSMTLDAVDLSSWDSTKSADAVPAGWTAKSGGVSVTADSNFEPPSIDAGDYKNILTATNGVFANANISDAIKYKAGAESSDTVNGITLTGSESKGVKASDDGKNLQYARSNFIVNDISLGSIAWNAGDTVRDGSAYDFATNKFFWDSDNFKNLTFTFADDTAYTSLATGAAMTLISNATEIDGYDIDASPTFDYTVANGAKLNTWVDGLVNIVSNAINYEVKGVQIIGVNLAKWDSTKAAFVVPESWLSRDGRDGQTNLLGPVPVTAAGFTAPTITAGSSKEIITTATTGFFNDNQITGALKYKADTESSDPGNGEGVTLTGAESKGVKASDYGMSLVYARSNFEVSGISLGEMTWGTGRAATTAYDFTNTATINASGLTFTNPEAVTGNMTLLSGATNLAAGKTVTGAEHSQNISAKANGATLSGTLNGTVSTTAGAVNYTFGSKKLNSVNLTGWNGTATTLTGWTPTTGGVAVTAAGFTAPTIAAGESTNILTTTTNNFFNDNQITGAMKYTTTTSSDTENGVTLTGAESKGVKASNGGKNLVYARSNFEVSGISLGNMTWGTAREATTSYVFNHVADANISAANLKFSNPESIAKDATTMFLSGATNLDWGTDIAHTQDFTKTVNGATLSATLSGNVIRTTAWQIGYTATSMTLDSVNLANWNGTTGSVPTGWTANLGANSITAAGFTAPTIAAGESTNILTTTTNNFFNNDQITGAMKYKADAESSDTENGVKLTGAESKGVKASNDGKNLVYARSKFDVNNIAFGEMTWGVSRDGNGAGYNYASAAIDTSGLKFANWKPEKTAANASTILLLANDTLPDFTAVSKNYSYSVAPTSGVTVDGSLNGSVSKSGDNIVYTATENKASQLTFGDVEWLKTGALIDHSTDAGLKNVSFANAVVDTSNINFINLQTAKAQDKMTLVSSFGSSIGTVTGTEFSVGKGKGEGYAYLESNDLKYVVTQGVDFNPTGDDNAINEAGDPVGGNITSNVIGGEAQNNGVAKENSMEVLAGSDVSGSVTAAISVNGASEKNEAKVTDANVSGSVTGAEVNGSGTAAGNKAIVENTNQNHTGDVIGAKTYSGLATGNIANVTGGKVEGSVIGAQSTSGTVSTGNEAKVSGANVGRSVYGGVSTDGEANANKAELSNGAKVGGDVYGGMSKNETATANSVTINNATITGDVYGGHSVTGTTKNNTVTFNGGETGTVKNLIGGGCETATDNTVTVESGTVKESVYGGKAEVDALNNHVILSGGSVTKAVYGGWSDSISGKTQNNSVLLYGDADVHTANIFGGNREATGNTLTIGLSLGNTNTPWTGGEQSVKNISNFENISFAVVPWSESKAAVTISDGATSDLSMSKVDAKKVHFTNVNSLKQSDYMTLLDQSGVGVTNKATNIEEKSEFTIGTGVQGKGHLSIDNENGNVLYTVDEMGASEQSHNTVMGATVGMAALSAGNDFVGAATEGLAMTANVGADGVSSFANMGGGSIRQETGSHIDAHTWNAILALGHQNKKERGTFEYGAFFEYGTGNYTTHNGDERGDGSTKYTGGGLLAKWTNDHGFYVEGSLRAGTVHDDARNVLRDEVTRVPYSYETDAPYIGFHLGVGKEIAFDDIHSLDVYGKYFYNRRNGVSFDAGGHYDLDAVTSQVVRVGARYTVKRDKWNFYGGVAYEHELDGKATGTVNTFAIRGADTSGGSFRGEIGATMKPGEDSPWSLDLNVSGFAGKKQGFTGGVSVAFMF